jgi:hypothetical protein
VSIWTTSPGFSKVTLPGLRMAWGRFLGAVLAASLRIGAGTG